MANVCRYGGIERGKKIMDFEYILIDFMARLLVLPLYPLLADEVDSERSEKPKRTPSEGAGGD